MVLSAQSLLLGSLKEQIFNNNEYKEILVPRKLSLKSQLAYGVGHVFNDVCSSMWFSYLLLFLQYVMNFNTKQAGFILLIGQVADAAANPFVGYLSDQKDSLWICRYGRRKVWHLLGTAASAVTFPFVFQKCWGCEGSSTEALLFYYSILTIIFQFAWAAVQISHLSLIPELTPDENERTRLAAIRYGFTVMSNIFVYVMAWFVIGGNSELNTTPLGPSDANKFQKIAWASLGIGLFCCVIFHTFVKEKSEEERRSEEDRNGGSGKLSDIFTNIEYYKVAAAYMSTMLFVNLTQVFIPLYLHETLEMSQSALAVIPLTIYLGSFATSVIVEKLNKHLGRKKAYATGAVIGVSACVWIKVRSSSPEFVVWEILAVALLVGFTNAIILVTNLGVTADLIGNNTGNGAFIYSLMTVTDKLANGFTVYVIQHLHDSFQVKTFYQNVVVYVCGVAVIIATFAVISVKRSQKKQEEYTLIP